MVALRGSKVKATAASRKAAEKAATVAAKGNKKITVAAAAGSTSSSASDAAKSTGQSGQEVQPPAMTNEEFVQRFVAYCTQACLSIDRNTQDMGIAIPVGKAMAANPVPSFLDAMLVTLCNTGKNKTALPQQILSRLTSASRKRVCGKIFSSDEIAYSCRNCQVDSTCVICKDCFMNGDHEGHDVYFQRTTAGSSCDCGDVHAWKRTGFCTGHPGAEEDEVDHTDGTAGTTLSTMKKNKKDTLPKALAAMAPVVVDAAVDFVYQVYLGIDQSFEFADALSLFSRGVPPAHLTELAAPPTNSNSPAGPAPATSVAPSSSTADATAPSNSMETRRRPRPTSALRRSTEPTSVPTPKPVPRVELMAVRLHNDDVHSLGEVVNDLCVALDYGKLSARATVNEADRHGDTVVAKMPILRCAAPVGNLVRESLNVSVAPQWWEKQMESVPAILEWLRMVSIASDGLYEIVSEALRKTRPRRLAPPVPISSLLPVGSMNKGFWKERGIKLHSTTEALIAQVIGGDDDQDLHMWATKMETALLGMYRFRVDATTDDTATEIRRRDQNGNVLIEEFVTAAALTPAYARHLSIRDGCAVLDETFLHQGDAAATTTKPVSLLGLMVRWDCALRKRTAHLGHALLREHMLNKPFRKCMLEAYARSYGVMTQSYLKGLGNSTDSIFDFAVQFLTVPHLVKDYTRSEVEKDPRKPRLAFELLAALEKVLATAKEDKTSKRAMASGQESSSIVDGVLNVDHPALSSQKYKHCIDDLEYVFNVGAMPNELVCDTRNLDRWISCLQLLQNGDLHVRRGIHEGHIEYEPDSWLSMFNLGIRIHSIFPVSWNGMTDEVLGNKAPAIRSIFQRILHATVSSSTSFTSKTSTKTLVPIKMFRHATPTATPSEPGFNVYDFKVASAPTSLHVPLHRFLASSMRHVSIHVSWLQDVLQSNGFLSTFALDALSTSDGLELVELPLRSLVMASQIHANMWRRNGEENMMAQLYNYSALPYCVHYRDADVFSVQVSVLMLGADTVLSLLVERFQLGEFFLFGADPAVINEMGYAAREPGVDDQQLMQMVEELLRLVIVLGTNLPSAVGEEYENLFLEEEMLQHLCAKSYSFSKLFDVAVLPTGQDDVSVPRLEQVLAQVATFSQSSGLEPGRYELKDGLLAAYNPYFLHLNRESHELARDRWTSYRKTQRQKHHAAHGAMATPPPKPAPLKRMRAPLPFLQKARGMLTCDGTLAIVHVVLWKVRSSAGGSAISDAVISTTLHLLVYGVYAAEEASEGEETHTIQNRKEESEAFWRSLCTPVAAMDGSSVLSLMWGLVHSDEASAASTLLDEEQTATLEWLVVKVRSCSPVCAALLDKLENKQKMSAESAAAAASTATTTTTAQTAAASGQPITLEQRKDEARKRALEAMARQQAAFQAMMATMDEDDGDEEAKEENDDDEWGAVARRRDSDDANDLAATSASTLGKRRASAEGTVGDADEAKRPRLTSEIRDDVDDNSQYKCILCHDTSTQGEMGVAAYVHQSTVLSGSFRPEPEEALLPQGARVRRQVKKLVERMDLCSGGPNVSSGSPSPALRALAAQFPDWYMDDGFDEELLLDSPLPTLNAMGGQRVIRHNHNHTAAGGTTDQPPRVGQRHPLGPFGIDARDLDLMEGALERNEDAGRLFPPLPVALRPVGGAPGGAGAAAGAADRDIALARRGPPPIADLEMMDSDYEDEDYDEIDDHDHDNHHHIHHHYHHDDHDDHGHHNHHHHNHHHGGPRRPRSASSMESAQLYLMPCGLHIRTCQHAVHIHCLERYIRSLHDKAIRGEDFDGVQAIDPDSAMTQFLCPLCKTLCNFLIPTSDPAGGTHGSSERRLAIEPNRGKAKATWHDIVDKQLLVSGWTRSVLGRDGDFGDHHHHGDDSTSDAHDLWRDYFEETLWEPHGSLEKGAPFLWAACAFSLASFLNVVEDEFKKGKAAIEGDEAEATTMFDPLRDACPPSLEKEFTSLIAVTKFCRWSFSLLEHSEDAKVIWETSKRCNPIHTETKREYRKFTKVLGSIDACLRGSILGLLVADAFTAFVISSVIADGMDTVEAFMPVFSAADLLQRVYLEFFVQSKSDERSLMQDKFSIVGENGEDEEGAGEGSTLARADRVGQNEEVGGGDRRRSQRSGSRAAAAAQDAADRDSGGKTGVAAARVAPRSAKESIQLMQDAETDTSSEEYAVLTLLRRIVDADAEEQLKPLTRKDLTRRMDRIKTMNAVLVRRMKLFWRCLSDGGETTAAMAVSARMNDGGPLATPPTFVDVAASPKPVFTQIWKWCMDRINNKSFLGIEKTGDKCEHAEGCGEGYIASMFILRDQATKPRLIDLPVQYDTLYSMLSGRKCTRCNNTPCDPGICLICGEFLCCGDSCCTRPFVNHGPQVGECTRHAAECGGGIGMVLMLDQCRVAIIGGSMAAHFPCPYVDAHGEEDVGLVRGRPLRLDMARYKHLESLWLNHRIFAEVSRQRNQREPQYTINLSYL